MTATTLRAYHGDPDLKAALLAEIIWHREQDRIVQGSYGGYGEMDYDTWRGCAIACSLRSLDIVQGRATRQSYEDHARYETGLGIPEWLAHLEDRLFEGMPPEAAQTWPERFVEAIPVGADLEPVKHRFLAAILREMVALVEGMPLDDALREQELAASTDAITDVITLHEQAITTGVWDAGAARAAFATGYATAYATGYATGYVVAYAASAVAYAASAAAAASAVADATAGDSREAMARYADLLLGLLRESEVQA